MKYRHLTTFLLFLFVSPAGFPQVKEPDRGSVLETTRKVADKVIRETSFDYRLVPMTGNAGIMRVAIDGHGIPEITDGNGRPETTDGNGRPETTDGNGRPETRDGHKSPETGDGRIFYAYGRMGSGRDTSGLLGLSFRGEIKLFLNGEEIFRGISPAIRLQEYTYDRYLFQHKIPVRWKKGGNELLVKFRQLPAPSEVLLFPLTENDTKAGFINPENLVVPGIQWFTSGHWHVATDDGMEFRFPPEQQYDDYYRNGGEIAGWEMENPPLLRELVIPETASYQRDAYSDWHYANGGTMLGMLSLFEVSGDGRYTDFVGQYAANLVANKDYFRWQYFNLHAMRGSFHRLFRMTMLDDSGGPAIPLAQMQLMKTGPQVYMPLLVGIRDYIVEEQERLTDGTFSRPEPEPATVWADDLFMSAPFLLRMAGIMGKSSLYDEVARQVVQFNKYLEDPATGLYFHGWFDRRRENSPVRWGRANGWIAWATAEALMLLPADHPGYGQVREIFRDHMGAIAAYQVPSGMWHQVLDHPETWEETSCTAMFTLAMARGVRMGWLDSSYRDRAVRGWNALQDRIAADGTVRDICRGTGIGGSVEFYAGRERFENDPRGLGAVITAGCEIHRLLKE